MRRISLAIVALSILCIGSTGLAQDKVPKVAIINIQAAIAQSNDGQAAAGQLQTRFAPKRTDLEKQQKEINDLQTQLRQQERTLNDETRARLLRQLDDKNKAFNRANEDATAEFQQAEQDAINEIGRKMIGVLDEYAKKNDLGVVLDVSSPQTPVLYADASIDITQKIIELYNQATAKPAASAAPAAPAPTAAPAARPAAPASTPPANRPAAPAAPPPANRPPSNP